MTRIDLQFLLEEILGSRNVYYQPPESTKMRYPAIVYSLNRKPTKHASNNVYIKNTNYMITLIDKNPDSSICDLIEQLPMCSFDRQYKQDNLNHFVYTIFI